MGRLGRGAQGGAWGDGRTHTSPRLRVVGADVYPDWEAVYRDNVDRVYRAIFAKVGNRADAEDLTAEVFLAALGPLRVSASIGEVRAYLSATARTVLAAHWRRHYGREITTLPETLELADHAAAGWDAGHPGSAPTSDTGPTSDTTQTPTTGPTSDTGPTLDTAEQLLAGLPERYQQVLRLRFLRGYSVRDTATELGVSVGHAKVLQHRALRRAAQLNEEATP